MSSSPLKFFTCLDGQFRSDHVSLYSLIFAPSYLKVVFIRVPAGRGVAKALDLGGGVGWLLQYHTSHL